MPRPSTVTREEVAQAMGEIEATGRYASMMAIRKILGTGSPALLLRLAREIRESGELAQSKPSHAAPNAEPGTDLIPIPHDLAAALDLVRRAYDAAKAAADRGAAERVAEAHSQADEALKAAHTATADARRDLATTETELAEALAEAERLSEQLTGVEAKSARVAAERDGLRIALKAVRVVGGAQNRKPKSPAPAEATSERSSGTL